MAYQSLLSGGAVTVSNNPSNPLYVTGNLTANVNLTGIALDATLTNGSQKTQVTNGNITISNPITGYATEITLANLLTQSNFNSRIPQLTVTNNRLLVDGSGVTQPVSLNSIPLASNAAQDRITSTNPSSVQLSDGTNFYKATTPFDTQPISGSVIANVGNTNGLALNSTLTNGNQLTKLTDGINVLPILNTTLVGNEYALVARTIPSGTQTVNGTITANLDSTNSNYLSNINNSIGNSITGVTIPAGGIGLIGWLSAIWKIISDRFPVLGQALVNTSIPVVLPVSQITTLTPPNTITANLDTTNSTYLSNLNTSIGTPITGTTIPSGGTGWFGWLSAIWSLINIRLPILGQALSSSSIPVVLPATQVSSLTPLNTVTANLGTIAGVSTSSNQTTANTLLTTISSNIPSNLTVSSTNRLLVDIGTSVTVSSTLTVFNAETPLTAPGTTSILDVSTFNNITCQYTVSSIGTNVVIRLQGSINGSTWFNLDPFNNDTTITSSITSAFILSNIALYRIRFMLVSISNGSPTVNVQFMAK